MPEVVKPKLVHPLFHHQCHRFGIKFRVAKGQSKTLKAQKER